MEMLAVFTYSGIIKGIATSRIERGGETMYRCLFKGYEGYFLIPEEMMEFETIGH